MKSRDHKIRRAEIKRRMRRMLRAVDRRWDALYSVFGAGVVQTVLGINFLLTSKPRHRIIWAIVFCLGVLFLVLYRFLLRLFRDQGYIRAWLTPLDHIIIGACFSISIFLQTKFDSEIALAGYLTAGVYGTFRLWKYSHPYWRVYHFRVAREYLWEIDPDNPNNSVKRDAPQAARPLP